MNNYTMSVDIASRFYQVLCRVSCTLSADSQEQEMFLLFSYYLVRKECFGDAGDRL